MMQKTVAHFIRKSSQLRASFIQNQILNHINYKPVIIYKYESEKDDGGFAEFDNDDIPVLNLWDKKDFKSKLLYEYPKLITKKNVEKINEFLEVRKVSVLHFHYGTDAGVYYPFLKQTKIPSVVSFYGYDCSGFPRRLFGYGKKYLHKRILPFITKVFAMSPDMKNDLLKIGCPDEKIIIHYYGSDVQKFYQIKNHRDVNLLNFLIIAGLEPQKGHIFLLRAFKDACEQNKNIRLKIFGAGKLETPIKKYIFKNNMTSNVEMMGKVLYGSTQHLNELQKADIFIHPSITDINGDKEGIPGAIVEAMVAGLPVISTNHAGIPYVIENGKTGLLVNEWDIKGLADMILKLSYDYSLRKQLGQCGQKFAMANLDLDEKEIELEKKYDSLV